MSAVDLLRAIHRAEVQSLKDMIAGGADMNASQTSGAPSCKLVLMGDSAAFAF